MRYLYEKSGNFPLRCEGGSIMGFPRTKYAQFTKHIFEKNKGVVISLGMSAGKPRPSGCGEVQSSLDYPPLWLSANQNHRKEFRQFKSYIHRLVRLSASICLVPMMADNGEVTVR